MKNTYKKIGVLVSCWHFGINMGRKFLADDDNKFLIHLTYLTNIGAYLTCLTIVLSIIKEKYPKNKKIDELSKFFKSFTIPLELLITILYWTMEIFFPNFLHHNINKRSLLGLKFWGITVCLHLLPIIYLFTDRSIKNINIGRIPFLIFGFSYYILIKYNFLKNGKWVYPFLNSLGRSGRVQLIFTCSLICIIINQRLSDPIENKRSN